MFGWLPGWHKRPDPDLNGLTPEQRDQLAASVIVAAALKVKENLTARTEAGFNFGAGKLLIGVHPVTLSAATVTARMKHHHTAGGKAHCLNCAYEDGIFAAVERWKDRFNV